MSFDSQERKRKKEEILLIRKTKALIPTESKAKTKTPRQKVRLRDCEPTKGGQLE